MPMETWFTIIHTAPLEYNKTSDASGEIAKFEVLTGVQIHEYNTNDSDAAIQSYGMYVRANGSWAISSSDLRGPAYTDWDTDKFSNFYKCRPTFMTIPTQMTLHLSSARMDIHCPLRRKLLKD